ncbi:hypothetical protein, partial [Phocaeicola coprophilus]|uniref:hypothetical protein n=1 Tax=Phocaeicola coprophilus TaxID=387090 RepID=UPI003078C0E6
MSTSFLLSNRYIPTFSDVFLHILSLKDLFFPIYVRTFAPQLRKKHRGVEQLVARWAHNPKV